MDRKQPASGQGRGPQQVPLGAVTPTSTFPGGHQVFLVLGLSLGWHLNDVELRMSVLRVVRHQEARMSRTEPHTSLVPKVY